MKVEIEIKTPSPYGGLLNESRISTYKDLAKEYNVEESTIRDVFNAGADWYRKQIND